MRAVVTLVPVNGEGGGGAPYLRGGSGGWCAAGSAMEVDGGAAAGDAAIGDTVRVLAAHMVPLLATWLPEESEVFSERVRPLLPFLRSLDLPTGVMDGLDACFKC